MSAPSIPKLITISMEIRAYRERIDCGVRDRLGIDGSMYRAIDRLFNILALAVTVYLIEEASVDPILAMAFAVLLIGGAEAFERLMLVAGDKQLKRAIQDRDREGEGE